MSTGTRLFTWLQGRYVGSDQLGNRYYRGRRPDAHGRERRWLLYAGEVEASRVPPEWHAWVHHTTDEPPLVPGLRRPWQKEHQPNLTGTPAAYRPPGHEFSGAERARGDGDYEPWQPS